MYQYSYDSSQMIALNILLTVTVYIIKWISVNSSNLF